MQFEVDPLKSSQSGTVELKNLTLDTDEVYLTYYGWTRHLSEKVYQKRHILKATEDLALMIPLPERIHDSFMGVVDGVLNRSHIIKNMKLNAETRAGINFIAPESVVSEFINETQGLEKIMPNIKNFK